MFLILQVDMEWKINEVSDGSRLREMKPVAASQHQPPTGGALGACLGEE